jgi:UV DNA damage endonuclease
MFRLGFPVKILGAPLRSHDSRRWQQQPHLSVSLAYVRDILLFLQQEGIHFYRLASQLAPYLTHPGLPQFHRQVEECAIELAAIGDLARQAQVRLTMHAGFFVQLSANDEGRWLRAQQELATASALLDGMGLGEESVIVVHVGGAGDPLQRRQQFARQYERLHERVRRRLALENDDRDFGIGDTLWLHKRTGVRLVFDVLHHRCCNPQRLELDEALALALTTWPMEQRPKVHFSSPRTELRVLQRNAHYQVQPPLPNQHSDYLNPFEVIDLLQGALAARLRPFDIMLEAKAKDLALLRLREQIPLFAPQLAPIVN